MWCGDPYPYPHTPLPVLLPRPRTADSSTGSATRHADESDGLETHVNTPNVRRQEHGDANSSRGAINVLVTPDLPVRSAKPRMGEPERPRDEMDVLDTCARMKSDAGNSKRPAKMSATLDLPATDVELCVSKPNGRVEHMYTRAEDCERLEKAYGQTRTCQNT